jgi:alpha-L-fucosidase 2
LPAYVYLVGIPLTQSKTLARVQLPPGNGTASAGSPALHIFSMAILQYASLSAAFNNVGTTSDSNTNPGNVDGGGDSFSENALSAIGASPGATGSVGGVLFTWPTSAGTGTPDNVIAFGQTIKMSGSGSTLGFLLSGTYGTASGTGIITYTDGSTQSFTLSAPDWWGSSSGAIALNSAYQNRPGNTRATQAGYVYFVGVPITPSKSLASVQLPSVSQAPPVSGIAAMHIFSMATH